MNKVRAAVLTGPQTLSLEVFERPTIGPDEGLLKIELAGLCGTDVQLFDGRHEDSPYPLIPGHEIVGILEEVGEIAAGRWGVGPGDRVTVDSIVHCGHCSFCLQGLYKYCTTVKSYGITYSSNHPPHLFGAYADLMFLAPGSIVHKVPEGVSPEAATLASPLANGLSWTAAGPVDVGDTVVIQGPGAQGLAVTLAAKLRGAGKVIVTGLASDAALLSMARKMGADAVIAADQEDVVSRVHGETGGEMADVVIDVSGSPSALSASFDLVRRRGALVLAGLAGSNTSVPIFPDRLVWNEIRLQGVYIKPASEVDKALTMLASGRFPQFEGLLTHTFPLSMAKEAILASAGRDPDLRPIKVAIAPESTEIRFLENDLGLKAPVA